MDSISKENIEADHHSTILFKQISSSYTIFYNDSHWGPFGHHQRHAETIFGNLAGVKEANS